MKTIKSTVLMEPVVGIEPTTYGLRNRRKFHDTA
jgi:hypothetical protein